jgi:hypothetical protein
MDDISVIAHVLLWSRAQRYASPNGGFYVKPIIDDLDRDGEIPGNPEYVATKTRRTMVERGLMIHEPAYGHFVLTHKGEIAASAF